ncbi:MAG: deaminase [Candidatus Parcubacteria bacterium]|nr:deaminase [Candidatus Parcubacteria bacterium]
MAKKIPRKWVKNVSKEALKKMIPEKIDASYERPSFKDVLAKQIVVVSKRSACLFYNVGVVIFKNDQVLSFGYNGPSKGDVHCYETGCARIIGGKLKEGSGMCRGSHAELNAIGNAAKNGVNIEGASMMLTIRPCKVCSKQIVNQGIKEVYYLFDYDRDKDVENYLRRLGIKLIHYQSKYLKKWMEEKQ